MLLRRLPEAQSRVLLNKQIDKSGRTANGQASQQLRQAWFFVCALGGLPLFSPRHFKGFVGGNQVLAFTRPIDYEHIKEEQVCEQFMARW